MDSLYMVAMRKTDILLQNGHIFECDYDETVERIYKNY